MIIIIDIMNNINMSIRGFGKLINEETKEETGGIVKIFSFLYS